MKNSINKTFKIFKYLSIIFTIVYWFFMLIDDLAFTNWLDYLKFSTFYYLIYSMVFSVVFWITSLAIILYKQRKHQSGSVIPYQPEFNY